MVMIITEHELRTLIPLDVATAQCVERAFHALSTKPVEMPSILRLAVTDHHGEVDVKTAYTLGDDYFAVKIGSGFFDNPKVGLPSSGGMMALFSSETGVPQAILLDNGYLTDIRTAAAGAVAAKYLARENAAVAAIFGAGVQAELQLEALLLVRPIKEARIWARDFLKAKGLAEKLSRKLSLSVIPYEDPALAVCGSDIIVTTTPASSPILRAAWLKPGQHVTAMGSDAEHKNEIEAAAIARADLYVADSLQQTRRLGELHHALASGLLPETSDFLELGDLIAEKKRGRKNSAQISIADLTGTGVQDTAIAAFAFQRAKAAGSAVGRTF
ncbi:cyclodeaminase [Mesorhizobium sp.]|uniref:cyclodeaminase n=1 Tax=Mesorhizobium sp. TaxID=1871066 RepID=UPI00257A640D|nr:cyclodeaminase [Mesorhizobium sp.]